MENKIINEKLNLIKKCVESYQIIPDNVAIMLMEQITNILFTIHVCGEEQRKFLDEVEKLNYEVLVGYGVAKQLGDDEPIIYESDFIADLAKVIRGE